MKQKIKETHKKDIPELFQKIETGLAKKNKKLEIIVLGGLAILLQDFRDRVTFDIDIAANKDAKTFATICYKLGIDVDIITVASTVDIVHAETIKQYSGKFLTVNSIMPEDLIKLKLERFYKQDPEDIYAIIEKTNLSYENFKRLVQEMLPNFIGNPQILILSAQEVVERKYLQYIKDFQENVK
ncbi:MAG: hypothetical protein A2W61_02285 [Deltaproteobacteria bacterium RIFCSPLOWO2_01_44_7]|nr:MAG: hypothetical protein A2W61_02285 [Deltaproteobacteria bacterium RIFCSPLOWO2_01_44_7]